MSNVLEGLNPQQKEAVLHINGPLLIFAGAGSGKTKVLTHRIAYLIEQGVAPQNILALTFTNKAAGEMKKRVQSLLEQKAESGEQSTKNTTNQQLSILNSQLSIPFLGTFHSFCLQFLKREIKVLGYRSDFSVYDEYDKTQALKEVYKILNLDPKQVVLKAVSGVISKAKNELKDPFAFSETTGSYFEEITAKIYLEYQTLLKKNNALDFDDLLMLTAVILKNNNEILLKYQNYYQYILIDEYQDTNTAQYFITNALAKKHQNLCVVGDDYQAIYSWRGADFRNILNFKRDYPNAKVIVLEQNYRSTKKILEAANEIIKKNQNKAEKNLWTQNSEGDPIVLCEAFNENDEARKIIEYIKSENKKEEKLNLKDFVVLYRTHAQSRAIEEALVREGIPYKIIGGLKFYDRAEIKDILAFLKIILNPLDKVSVIRVINKPVRSIGNKTIEKIDEYGEKNGLNFIESLSKITEILGKDSKSSLGCQEFYAIYEKIKQKSEELDPSSLIDFILEESGYKSFIIDGTLEGEARMENILELKSTAEIYSEFPAKEGLKMFLEKVSLITDLDTLENEQNVLTLMTLHNAKGLEYNQVFLVGMEEGLFPHSRSLDNPHEMEEERRLCYVGFTRARKKLFLSYASSRLYFGSIQSNLPSRFLQDVPRHLIKDAKIQNEQTKIEARESYKIGDKVSHQSFGEGVVADVMGDEIVILFGKAGYKTLSLDFAVLKKH